MKKPKPKPPPPKGLIELYKVPKGVSVELSDGKVVQVLAQEGIYSHIYVPNNALGSWRVDGRQFVRLHKKRGKSNGKV